MTSHADTPSHVELSTYAADLNSDCSDGGALEHDGRKIILALDPRNALMCTIIELVETITTSPPSTCIDAVPPLQYPTLSMSVGDTYGAAFLGLIPSAISYPRDPKLTKWLVGFLWVVDTVHLALCTATIYWYLVSNFGDFPNLGVPHWSFDLQAVASAIVILSVQLFFVRRVHQLSKNKSLVALIVAFAAIHFALGVYVTVATFILNTFAAYKFWIIIVGLGSAAVADVLIALSLLHFLRKSRTGFARMDGMIAMLILYSVNTGLLTSIGATTTVIICTLTRSSHCKSIETKSRVAQDADNFCRRLNSRETLRERFKPKDGSIVHFSNMCSTVGCESPNHKNPKLPYGYAQGASMARPPLEVTVEMATEVHADTMSFPVDGSTSPDLPQ
ncbi:hypothetical protein BD410DRAFT_877345 [Rickenella mellea]|uniref:DUF6534 domain-containing protein n=1 Tax=Rickenella mellea TaxID=50990 RepID=A0A4Y7PW09_9AGAM|nr:hypothetical protein BD410DRAFT_877345 [Rickenella mellea]